MRPLRLTLALAFLALPLAARAAETGPVTVFAAASMTNAMKAVAHAYEAKTGRKIALSFAGSSVLAKQIDASGGADLFISADQAWMDYLEKRGRIVDGSREALLGNRLVLIAPKDSATTLKIGPHFPLVKALGGSRLAVADTATVPAGRYAKEALTNLGVWKAVAARLAPAENVRVALAYVARGEAPLGIVYRTDALIEPRVRIVAAFPDSSHTPIIYPAALIKGARPGAARFLAFLRTPSARTLFKKSGFRVLRPASDH